MEKRNPPTSWGWSRLTAQTTTCRFVSRVYDWANHIIGFTPYKASTDWWMRESEACEWNLTKQETRGLELNTLCEVLPACCEVSKMLQEIAHNIQPNLKLKGSCIGEEDDKSISLPCGDTDGIPLTRICNARDYQFTRATQGGLLLAPQSISSCRQVPWGPLKLKPHHERSLGAG